MQKLTKAKENRAIRVAAGFLAAVLLIVGAIAGEGILAKAAGTLVSSDPDDYSQYFSTDVDTIDSSEDVINSQYAFTAKFIEGVTTVTYSSGLTDSADLSITGVDNKATHNYIGKADITGITDAGAQYIIYHNVGTYQGQTVNLKITIRGYSITGTGYRTTAADECFIYFSTDMIGIYFRWMNYVDFQMEYLDDDGNVMDISSYVTFSDVDSVQSLAFSNDSQIDKILLDEDTTISLYKLGSYYYFTGANKNLTDTATSPEGYVMALLSQGTLNFRYTGPYYMTNGYTGGAGNSYAEISAYKLTKTDTTEPTKTVTDDNEINVTTNTLSQEETFTYTIYETIPQETEDYYYTDFILRDTLPTCVTYKSSVIYNDEGEELTADGTWKVTTSTSTSGVQTIVARATNTGSAEFYYQTYRWVITVTFNRDALSDFEISSGSYMFTNTPAAVTIYLKAQTPVTTTKTGNTVTTYYYDPGNLTVKKVVNTGDAVNASTDLSGFAFHLTGTSKAGDTVDLYAVTDSDGYAYFTDVPIGTGYKLYEVSASDVGYAAAVKANASARAVMTSAGGSIKDPDDYTFGFPASYFGYYPGISITSNSTRSITWTNYVKQWNLTVYKMDSEIQEYNTAYSGLTLDGAVYYLYDSSGNKVDEYTVENGMFTTDYYVCCDDWYLMEYSAPTGYAKDETIYYITGTSSDDCDVQYNTASLTNGSTIGTYKNVVLETRETVTATIVKNWNDNNNAQSVRPSSLDVYLYRESAGTTLADLVTAETLNGSGNWTATVTGLDKYDSNGKEYSYYWTEESIPSVTVSGQKITYTANSSTVHSGDTYTTTITNSTSGEDLTTDVTIVKEVDDSGTGETDVSGWAFYLSGTAADGTDVQMYALSDMDGNAVFPQVPYSGTGGYTVTEVSADDVHTAAVNGNAYALAIDGSVTKDPADCESVWSETITVDASTMTTYTATNTLKSWYITVTKMDSILQKFNTAQNGYTLDGAVYGLYNGNTCVAEYTVENGQFTTTTTDSATGVYYTCGDDWYIKEISAPTGYTLDETEYAIAASSSDIGGVKEPAHFTDEYRVSADGYDDVVFEDPELVSATIVKGWSDNSNSLGVRPTQLTVYLYRSSATKTRELVKELTITSTDNSTNATTWSATVTDLVKYDTDGSTFSYFWEEDESGLTSSVVNGQKVTYAKYFESTSTTTGRYTTTIVNRATTTVLYTTVTVHKTIDTDAGGVDNTDASGFAFRLYGTSAAGDEVDMYAVTDASGAAVFTEVPYSDANGYTVTEVSYSEAETAAVDNDSAAAILGSITKDLNDYTSVWSDTVMVDSETAIDLYSVNTLKSWYITVTKMDSELLKYGKSQSGATLQGAVYGLYDADNTEIARYTTDENGQFSTNSTGVYYACCDGWYIREISPSTGYAKDETQYFIDASNTTITGVKQEAFFTPTSVIDGYNNVVLEEPGETQVVTATVTKTWDDGSNEMGTRPSSVKVYLYSKDSRGNTEMVNSSGYTLTGDDWSCSVENLPRFDSYGGEYEYYWEEDPDSLADTVSATVGGAVYTIDGYRSSAETTHDEDAYTFTTTITNTITVYIPVTVTKTWVDDDDTEGLRPDVLYVYAVSGYNRAFPTSTWVDLDGNAATSATTADTAIALTEADGWTATVIMPKYDSAGNTLLYRFNEINSTSNSVLSAVGYIIVDGQKVSIASMDFSWYTGDAQTGYKLSGVFAAAADSSCTTSLTNTHSPNGGVTVQKTIDDGGTGNTDRSGFAFCLAGTSADGSAVEEYAVTGSDGLAYFTDIPYSDADGYTVTEVSYDEVVDAAVAGSSSATDILNSGTEIKDLDYYDTTEAGSQTVVVSGTENITVQMKNTVKSWYITVTKMDSILKQFNTAQDGYTLDGAVYGLFNGVDADPVATFTVTGGQFSTNSSGVYYPCGDNWYIQEVTAPAGYAKDEASYCIKASVTDIDTAMQETDFTDECASSVGSYDNVVFEDPEMVEATVTKIWRDDSNSLGQRPSEISVTLYRDSANVTGEFVVTETLDSSCDWTATIDGLMKVDPYNSEYSYYWEEDESILTTTVVDGQQVTYAMTSTSTDHTGDEYTTTIINTATVVELETEVKVIKTVDDGGTGVTVDLSGFAFRLYGTSATGSEVNMYAATDASGEAVFSSVPYSDAGGYTVTEVTKTEVETAAQQNVYTAMTIDTSSIKDLDDYVTPDSKVVYVENTDSVKVAMKNILKSWFITVTKMDSILQTFNTAQDGYTLDGAVYGLFNGVDADPVATFTVTGGQFSTNSSGVYYPCGDNWYIQEISAPTGYARNETVYYIAASNTDISGAKEETGFTSVSAYSAGGYDNVVLEDPQLVSSTVTVTWEDHDDELEVRPDTVMVYLYRDNDSGNPEPVTGVEVELPDNGNWEYTVTGLVKYDPDGGEYSYFWTQEELPGSYTIPDAGGDYDIDGYGTESETEHDTDNGIFTTGITNTLEVMIPVTVTKVWDDEDDIQKIRPDAVYALLFTGAEWLDVEGIPVDGTNTADTAVVLDESNDWYVRLILPKYGEDNSEIPYAFTEVTSSDSIVSYIPGGAVVADDSIMVNGKKIVLDTLDFSWYTDDHLTGYAVSYEYGTYGTGMADTQTVITNSHTPNTSITLTEIIPADDFTYYYEDYGKYPSFTFELEDENGNVTEQVFEITPDYVATNTDPDGNVYISVIFENLTYGTYTITKTIQAEEWTNVNYDAENGTVKPEEVTEFTIGSSTIENGLTLLAAYEEAYEPTAKITVTKLVSVSSLTQYAKDAEFTFTLTAEDGTLYTAESTTITFAADMDTSLADGNGYFSISATFTGLPYGTVYTLSEESMPEMWVLSSVATTANGEAVNDTDVRYEITKATAKDTYSAVYTDEYISGTITIIKYGNGSLLDGVSYTLYDSDGDTVATGTTGDDGDGTVIFTGLAKGTYIITETATVNGYALLADEITAEIPMTLTDAEYEQYKAAGITIDVTAAVSYRNGVYTFTDLTYEITDEVNLALPRTGEAGRTRKILVIVFAGLILIAGITVTVSLVKEHRTGREDGPDDTDPAEEDENSSEDLPEDSTAGNASETPETIQMK